MLEGYVRTVEFRVLGPVQVGNGAAPTPLGGPKQRAVLAALIARVGEVVPADSIIDTVWGEAGTDARASLHTYISNLRSALEGRIERIGSGYRLNVEADEIDAAVFEEIVDEARAALSVNPLAATERLRAGLALWRGRPYADLIDLPGLQAEIRRLERLREIAVEARIDADLALGRHTVVLGELEALAAEHPFNEGFRARHMIALYRDGRQAEALRAYAQTRELLVSELGVDPSSELQAVEERILQHDPTLLVAADVRTEDVAILFTDIEDSTILWETRPDAMRGALARHDQLLEEAITGAGGRIFKHTGDGLLAAFVSAPAAVRAATAAQTAIAGEDWGELGPLRCRMSVDVGEVDARAGDYFGAPMNRGARLMGAAHGGQVLLSATAQERLGDQAGLQIRNLGEHRLKGLGAPQQVFQLVIQGLAGDFPDLRTDAAGAEIGREFGDAIRGYELRERIGVGRFGVVYRAYQPAVGREVAIKVIRPEYAGHPAFVRTFEAEARLVAKLEHPHIVSMYDFWRDSDGAYLVMPHLPGRSLAGNPFGAMPPARVVEIVRQIGSALDYAHRQGVIHRDVKPANVLLDADGNAYLSDFGIAVRAVEQAIGLAPTSQIYRAPEDRAGGAVDERTDVYGLGAVIVELLTGTRPGDGDLSTLAEPLRAVIERALQESPAARFESIDDLVRAFTEAAGSSPAAVRTGPSRNPYKGLAAFDETDARDFFGRDAELDELAGLVASHRVVTVVGPSGTGKSSLVRAGLVPALRAGRVDGSADWLVVTMVPSAHPFDELATVIGEVANQRMGDLAAELRSDEHGLLRIVRRLTDDLGGELVIVVDQFEELYSLVAADTRRRFVDSLLEAAEDPHSRLRVVVTIRADYFDRPLLDDRLGTLVSDANLALAVPGPAALLEAIEGPAAAANLTLEPGLAQQVVADVRNEPGGLPLMQFVLTDLVAAAGDAVTIADYTASGGVTGALSARADAVYASLSDEDQDLANQIFLRLVTVAEDAGDVRRRVRRSELEALATPESVGRVLDAFGNARLLTFDRDPITRGPTVEIAHEALLREWDTYRRWIDSRRAALLTRRRFRTALDEWDEADRPNDLLPTGGRLAGFEDWAADPLVHLTPDERTFLDAALTRREEERADRRRRRRRVLAGFALAALIASVLAVAASLAWRAAARGEELAQARALQLSADANRAVDPELALLLATEATERYQLLGDVPADAQTSLRQTITANRVVGRYPYGGFVVVDATGDHLATRSQTDDGIAFRSVQSGELTRELADPDETFEFVEGWGTTGGAEIYVLYQTEGAFSLWATSFTSDEWHLLPPGEFRPQGSPSRIDVSPEGGFVSFVLGDRLSVIDRTTEESVFERQVAWGSAAWFQTEGLIAYLAKDDPDARTLRLEHIEGGSAPVDIPDLPFQPAFLQFEPQGSRIAIAVNNAVGVINPNDRSLDWHSEEGRSWTPLWLPDRDEIVVGGEDVLRRVDASTGAPIGIIPGHRGGSWSYAKVPNSSMLATAGRADGQTILIDLEPVPAFDAMPLPFSEGYRMRFSADADLLVIDNTRTLAVIDLPTGRIVQRHDEAGDIGSFTMPTSSRNGLWIAAVGEDALSHLWAVTGELVYSAPAGWTIRGVSNDGELVALSRLASLTQIGGVSADRELAELSRLDSPTQIVRTTDAQTLASLDAGARITHAFFADDGQYVVTNNNIGSGNEFGFRVFDLAEFNLVTEFGSFADYLWGWETDWSKDGRTFVTSGGDGVVRVMDFSALLAGADPMDTAAPIEAHDTFSYSVRISPDGSMLVSSAFDEPAKLWTIDGQPLGEFGGSDHTLAAFHPSEPYLYVIDGSTLTIYPLDIDELLDIARSRLTREFTESECQQYLQRSCDA